MNGPTPHTVVAPWLLSTLSDWADVWWRWTLLGFWQGLASAVIVGAVLWLGRRRISAPLRHALLVLLLVKLAMPPLPAFPLGVFTWLPVMDHRSTASTHAFTEQSIDDLTAIEPDRGADDSRATAPYACTQAASSTSTVSRLATPLIPAERADLEPSRFTQEPSDDAKPIESSRAGTLTSDHSSLPEAGLPVTDFGELSGPSAASRTQIRDFPWRIMLMIAHGSGSLAVLLAVTMHYTRLIRRTVREGRDMSHDAWMQLALPLVHRLGLRRVPTLVISPGVDTPCVTGWRQPTIYLPQWANQLNDSDRAALVVHELAHIYRGDHWMAPIQCILVSWLWWNPLAWYVGRQIRRERERCCDDIVLSQHCCDRQRYANLLVTTLARASVRRWFPVGTLGMAKATEPIADRLLRIMEPVTRAPRMRRWELMVTTVLAAALLPSVRQQASPAAEPVPGSAPDALSGTQLHESAAPYRAVESISTEESGPARHDSSAPLPANGESNLNVLVRDRAGAPVAGVQAHLRHGGKSFVFDGNAQGVVRIELPAPPADLQFPFFDITWPGFTRSHTVSIKRGEPLPETLEVTLPVTRTVRGRLIDHEDRPVTKARICSGFTAANVAVPMRDWPNGEFVVQAAATDPKFGPNREGPILLAVEAPDLAVAVVQLTETGEPLTIRLGPGKPVGGRVVDPQGAPVAGVRLISDFVGPSNPPILKIETVTDATGIFWFAHYPADVPMKFSVMHSEYANLRMQEFTPGKVDYQLMLQPVLIVAGRVVDAVTDEPLGQIVVQQGIIGGGRTNWRSKRPVAFFEGRFEMKFAEAPTNTALRIIADGFQPLVLEPPINQYSKPNQTFELRRSHVVSLRVLTADGQPAPGFVAELRGGADADMLSLVPAVRDRRMSMLSAALPIGAELDETGRARITNAPSGKQVLTVYDTAATVMYQEEIEVGPALATKEHVIRIVPAPVAAVPARPAPGASDSNARTAAAKPAAAPGPTGVGNILVRAVRDGKPLVMAQVGLIPKPGFQSQFQGRTGQDGTHLFGGLSPGPYEVEIYDGFIYVADQQLTKLRRSLLVAIEPGKTLDILALGGPGAALDGVLLDDAGKPMPGIFTLITYLGAEPPVGVRGGATAVPFMMEQVEQAKAAEPATDSAVLSSMTVHTDSAGKFTVPELAPGYYQVMFRRGGPNPDFQLHTQFAVKPDQRRVAVEFRPKRSGRLTPGQQLPRIDGRNLEGNEMQVAGIQGKVLLVEFWASWNKPSLIGMAAMKKLHEKFAGADVVLIGVNLDQDHDSMKRAALDHAVNWQQVHVPAEQANALLDGFGIRALPERLLVGKDGRLVAFGLDDDEMITAIETELRK